MKTRMNLVAILIALATVSFLGGCPQSGASKDSAPAASGAAASKPSAASLAAAEKFSTLCASCHGASGQGDGPAAAALDPKPRNYSDAAWQASVSDEDLSKIILEGGAAVGKSPIMPPSADLKDKPEVVKGLVQLVREMGK